MEDALDRNSGEFWRHSGDILESGDEILESDPKLGPTSKAVVKLSRLDRHIADTASQFRQEGRKRRRASSAGSEGSRKKKMRRGGTLHIDSGSRIIKEWPDKANLNETKGQWPFRPAATRAMRNRHKMLYDLYYLEIYVHIAYNSLFGGL